jgi:hypothetical protein
MFSRANHSSLYRQQPTFDLSSVPSSRPYGGQSYRYAQYEPSRFASQAAPRAPLSDKPIVQTIVSGLKQIVQLDG